MEFSTKNIILLLSVITTALSAGLLYAWVISIIPGTKKIPDQAYLETMQTLNKEILNIGFIFIFFGALIFLLCNIYLQYKIKVDTSFYLMSAATVIYAVGTIGVTMFGNVPLNDVLEALNLSSLDAEGLHNTRLAYEEKWNNFHFVRTAASLISFLLILLAFGKN